VRGELGAGGTPPTSISDIGSFSSDCIHCGHDTWTSLSVFFKTLSRLPEVGVNGACCCAGGWWEEMVPRGGCERRLLLQEDDGRKWWLWWAVATVGPTRRVGQGHVGAADLRGGHVVTRRREVTLAAAAVGGGQASGELRPSADCRRRGSCQTGQK
jgi:hypothetical protein